MKQFKRGFESAMGYPSGSVTFLFTDIEGSTTHWESHPNEMQTAVERHFSLLRDAIHAHHGALFKIVGDAVQAAFDTAEDGLAAAVAAQQSLTAERWGTLGSLRVRMALHTGSATPNDGDYRAPCLNVLARILAAGHGGQILLSAATRNLLHATLPEEMAIRALGEYRLRSIRQLQPLFQLNAPGLSTEFPRPTTLPRDWPTPTTPLIGREVDLETVRALLREQKLRLVTLVGAPGVGKTRLALEVAEDLMEDYQDGAYFIDLATIADSTLVVPTIAHQLGASRENANPLDGLVTYLNQREVLVVLDNFEGVLLAASFVTDLLHACPSLTVLVTSRTPLELMHVGEQRYPVEPLPVPDLAQLPPVEQLLEIASIRMFVGEATRINPQFTLTSDNGSAVALVCWKLRGLPLALKLAAVWLNTIPVQVLAEQLERQLDWLEEGSRDLPARHQTMRAAVAWSYDLLSSNEQHIFRSLSLFRGPCSLPAAESVCIGNHSLTRKQLHRRLKTLVDRGLIQMMDDSGEPLYSMLPVIGEYGRELLEQTKWQPDAEVAKQHFIRWYRQLADRAAHSPRRQDQDAAFRQLAAQFENVRAILDGYIEDGNFNDLLEVSTDIAIFLWRYGYYSEGRRWLETGLRGAPDAREKLRVVALDRLGCIVRILGDYTAAIRLHQESLALSRRIGNQIGQADALGNLALVYKANGDLSTALDFNQRSLKLYQRCGDIFGQANVLGNMGSIKEIQGDLEEAVDLWQKGLSLFRQADDADGEARALSFLGGIAAQYEEDLDRGRRLHEEALQIRQQVPHRRSEIWTLTGLGRIALKQQEYERARELFAKSVEISRKINDQQGEAEGLAQLADVAHAMGDYPSSRQLFEQSLALFRRVGDAEREAWTSDWLEHFAQQH